MSADVVITILCGLAILLGTIGVVVPVLPGLLLSWAGVLAWAVFVADGWLRWVVVAMVTALAVGATTAKYLWPGRRLKSSGVPNSTLLLGVALGAVGFFVIPFVGLPLGFVLGVWLAEWARLGDRACAWPSTREALRATGIAMLIELCAAFLIAIVWLGGLFTA